MTAWLLLAAALLLILACGVFVAAEFSFVTVDRTKVDQAAADGDAGAKGVQRALRTLSTQLSGAQVGITITNLAIGYLAEPAISDLIDGPLESAGVPAGAITPVAVGIGLTVGTILTMIFGELVPKNLALAKPMEVARATQRFQRGFTAVMRGPIQRAQRLGQRVRPSTRDRAAGGAAIGAQLHRARLPGPTLRHARHPRPRDRRADGALRGVRVPHRGRDHDPAGPYDQPRRQRPRHLGDRDGPPDRPLPLPGASTLPRTSSAPSTSSTWSRCRCTSGRRPRSST